LWRRMRPAGGAGMVVSQHRHGGQRQFAPTLKGPWGP
jgi:hypothetical protein